MRKSLIFVSVVLVTTVASCRCGRKEPQSTLDLVPASAPFALSVHRLDSVSRSLEAFVARLSRGLMEPVIARGRSWIVDLLGFSPGEAEGWARLGMDAERGVAIFWEEGYPVLVLSLANEKNFDDWLTRLAETRWNARPEKIDAGGEKLVEWRQAAGNAVLRGGKKGPFFLLAGPQIQPERLAAFLHLEEKDRLSSRSWPASPEQRKASVEFFFSTEKISSGQNLATLLGSRAAGRLEIASDRLELYVSWEKSAQPGEKSLPEPVDTLKEKLPADVLAAIKMYFPPEKFHEMLQVANPALAESVKKWLEVAADYLGAEFRKGLYENLKGDFLLLAGIDQEEKLTELVAAGVPRPELVSSAIWLALVAGVRDAKALEGFTENLASKAGNRMSAAWQQVGELRVARFEGEMGYQLQFFQRANRAGLCVGASCLERVGRIWSEGQSGVQDPALLLFSQPALFSGYVHLGRLSGALQKAFSQSSLAEKLVVDTLASVLGTESSVAFALIQRSGYYYLQTRFYCP